MYVAPWHGCARFHSQPDDPSATAPTSPQTRATPVRECLLLRPRPLHPALRRLKTDTSPIYANSSPDHPILLPLIAHHLPSGSALDWQGQRRNPSQLSSDAADWHRFSTCPGALLPPLASP